LTRQLHAVIALAVAALVSETGRAADQFVMKGSGVITELSEESKNDSACNQVLSFLDIYLRALNRYPPGPTGKPVHRVHLSCANERFEATWSLARTDAPTEQVPVARVELPRSILKKDNHPSVALLIQQDLSKGIPWDGEIAKAVDGKSAWSKLGKTQRQLEFFELKSLKKVKNRKRARFSVGVANSDAIAACAPIEIGTMEPATGRRLTFRPVAVGLITQVDVFASFGEYWPKAKTPGPVKDAPLFFRYYDPAKDDKQIKQAKSECTKLLGYQGNRTLDALLSGNLSALFSSETIELNAINQAAGATYFTYNSGGQQKIPGGLAGYITNRVQVGDLFLIHFDVMREVYAKSYQPTLIAGQKAVPHFSVGELYGSAVYHGFDWHIYGGAGFFYSKFNVPIESDDLETASQQTTTASDGTTTVTTTSKVPERGGILSLALNMGGGWEDDALRVTSRLAASFGGMGPHLSSRTSVDFMLTNTWYVGTALYLMRYGESKSGEPSGEFYSIGAHIGFDLNRGGKL
jgi:hypothetical protein